MVLRSYWNKPRPGAPRVVTHLRRAWLSDEDLNRPNDEQRRYERDSASYCRLCSGRADCREGAYWSPYSTRNGSRTSSSGPTSSEPPWAGYRSAFETRILPMLGSEPAASLDVAFLCG